MNPRQSSSPSPLPSPSAPMQMVESDEGFDMVADTRIQRQLQQEEEDAALAQRLQELENQERYRRAQDQSRQMRPTQREERPPAYNSGPNVTANGTASSRQRPTITIMPQPRAYHPNDDLFELNGGHNSGHNKNSNSNNGGSNSRPTVTIMAIPSDASTTLTDEEIARKIQQHYRDEQFALQLQAKENERLRNNQTNNPNPNRDLNLRNNRPNHQAPPNRCNRSRIQSAGCMAVITGLAIILVVTFGTNIWKRLGGDPDALPPFFQDKWSDTETEQEFSEWKTKKTGLKLTLRNALTSDWDTYFEEAVVDWNESPSLSLETERFDADPYCGQVKGILKVCNDFYGQTGWTGLNEVYYEGDFIAASVAKMNESYLKGKKDSEKLYVMCHELGHGFGLPHRDEIPNNPDLGSCLDYTYRYKNNMRPDNIVDFDNLANLYGKFETRNLRNVGHGNPKNVLTGHNGKMLETQPDEGLHDLDATVTSTTIQESTRGSSRRKQLGEYAKGRLLHESEHFSSYERIHDDGTRVVTTFLHAQEE